jgi:hypothetical protein
MPILRKVLQHALALRKNTDITVVFWDVVSQTLD